MSAYALTQQWQIVHGGGPITRETFKGDGSSTWKKGQLLELSAGTMVPAVALGSSPAEIDTDDIADPVRLFIALEDLDAATSGYVTVQEITSETVFCAQLCSGDVVGDTVPVQALIGTQHTLYQLANGVTGVDENDTTTPVVEIVDIEANFNPYLRSASYGFVYVRFIGEVLA